MIRILIAALFIAQILGQTPPNWPESFHQAYTESHGNGTARANGRFFYDSRKPAQRTDLSNGTHDAFCHSVFQDSNNTCTHLYTNSALYIISPQRRQCCWCCDAAHGCKPYARDWLKDAHYEGEQTIYNESFWKWSWKTGNETDYYHETKTTRIPRRLTWGTRGIDDYHVNTYSTDPIPDTVFAVPTYCANVTCPTTSICGGFRNENLQSY